MIAAGFGSGVLDLNSATIRADAPGVLVCVRPAMASRCTGYGRTASRAAKQYPVLFTLWPRAVTCPPCRAKVPAGWNLRIDATGAGGRRRGDEDPDPAATTAPAALPGVWRCAPVAARPAPAGVASSWR